MADPLEVESAMPSVISWFDTFSPIARADYCDLVLAPWGSKSSHVFAVVFVTDVLRRRTNLRVNVGSRCVDKPVESAKHEVVAV